MTEETSRFQTPKYDSLLEGIILQANDVVATVLIISTDEGSYCPETIADVDLPYEAREFRKKTGYSMFQRGDLIDIRCTVTRDEHNGKFTEEDIETAIGAFYDGSHEENAPLLEQIAARAKNMDSDWKKLCERDRQSGKVKVPNSTQKRKE